MSVTWLMGPQKLEVKARGYNLQSCTLYFLKNVTVVVLFCFVFVLLF